MPTSHLSGRCNLTGIRAILNWWWFAPPRAEQYSGQQAQQASQLQLQLQWQFQETTMAFVRKKGKSYYLVHNDREDGHVRQVHLACLGNRPRISNEVLEQVRQSHPQLQIDWAAVRARAADTFVSPFADLEGAQMLVRSMRTLHQ